MAAVGIHASHEQIPPSELVAAMQPTSMPYGVVTAHHGRPVAGQEGPQPGWAGEWPTG